MNIGIISDTHNRIKPVEKAFKSFKDRGIGLVVHCGDWIKLGTIKTIGKLARKYNLILKGVPGNNDFELQKMLHKKHEDIELDTGIDFPRQDLLEIFDDGERIAIYHGHNRVLLNKIIESGNYTAVFTGHTHHASIKNQNGTLVINPGSIQDNTYAVFDTEKNAAEVKMLN